MEIEIGSYEAKTKLPELLRGVQAGNHYTITSRGKPVAALRPIEEVGKLNHADAADAMLELMMSAKQNAKSGANVNIKALIEDGRA